jgi:hypothetical protein
VLPIRKRCDRMVSLDVSTTILNHIERSRLVLLNVLAFLTGYSVENRRGN